ncbi:MAG: hypothetical protein ABIC82_01090 [bacterium]
MNNLAKITKLLSRGENIIVVNEQIDPQFVIMGLSEYEKVINSGKDVKGLTEEELLTKINRDIAIWKSMQEYGESDVAGDNFVHNIRETEEEEDEYYFEPVDDEDE